MAIGILTKEVNCVSWSLRLQSAAVSNTGQVAKIMALLEVGLTKSSCEQERTAEGWRERERS